MERALARAPQPDRHGAGREVAVPPDRADQRALLASLDQERAGLRVEVARVRTQKEMCAEPREREKPLREELTALEARIRACEQANLDPARAQVAQVRVAVLSMTAESSRCKVELNTPPRVRVLALAAVPGG
jgi:hypothetical protein